MFLFSVSTLKFRSYPVSSWMYSEMGVKVKRLMHKVDNNTYLLPSFSTRGSIPPLQCTSWEFHVLKIFIKINSLKSKIHATESGKFQCLSVHSNVSEKRIKRQLVWYMVIYVKHQNVLRCLCSGIAFLNKTTSTVTRLILTDFEKKWQCTKFVRLFPVKSPHVFLLTASLFILKN